MIISNMTMATIGAAAAPMPNAESFGNWMLIAGWLATLVVAVLGYVDRRGTQRREVVPGTQYTTIERSDALEQRLATLEAKVETLRSEMKEDRESAMAQGELRASKIHERINSLGERLGADLAKLGGMFEAANSRHRGLPGSDAH